MISYREFAAPRELADLVVCTWERAVPGDAEAARVQRVLPDACVDLVWRGGWLWTAGPDSGPFMSPLSPGETVVGMRLKPGVAACALGLPANEIRDMRVPVDELWGTCGRELAERIGGSPEAYSRRRLLLQYMLSRRSSIPEPDRLVLAAIPRLGLPGSRVRLIGRELGMSERQLLRRFKTAVGYGPKTVDRVLRFQRFLEHAAQVTGADEVLARTAAELGYADHAHLSRDCSRLAGVAPTSLIEYGGVDQ